jgi:hypothetical protein
VAFRQQPALKSSPFSPGMCRSVIMHAVSLRQPDARNCSAEPKIAPHVPTRR